jgi:hypothetical protein
VYKRNLAFFPPLEDKCNPSISKYHCSADSLLRNILAHIATISVASYQDAPISFYREECLGASVLDGNVHLVHHSCWWLARRVEEAEYPSGWNVRYANLGASGVSESLMICETLEC